MPQLDQEALREIGVRTVGHRLRLLKSIAALTSKERDLGPNLANDPVVRPVNLREARESAERDAILQALTLAKGRVVQAADALGVSRPTLYTLLAKYGITAKDTTEI